MTQEDKDLLFVDLCGRLPHMGFMVQWHGEDYNIIDIGFGRVTVLKPFMSMTSGSPLIEEVKPYLRSMSTMTEEELERYDKHRCHLEGLGCVDTSDTFDWLDANYFDYRGLIPKGIALEAPKDMYKLWRV